MEITNITRKLRYFLVTNIVCRYLCWCTFFYLQGIAINLAVQNNTLSSQLIQTLLFYILVKIIVMLSDVLEKYIVAKNINDQTKEKWKQLFPQKIYRDNEDKHNYLYLLFFDYIPKVFNLEIKILTNYAIIFSILTITIFLFISTQFYIGLLALLGLFILNAISKNLFIKKIEESTKEIHNARSLISSWIFQFFSSFKEIDKNWRINKSKWISDIYSIYHKTQKEQNKYYFYKDMVGQGLIEFPFLLSSAIIIYSVYYGFISLKEVFVWVGFTQFMIDASNAYLENKTFKKQKGVITNQSIEVLNYFKSEPKIQTSKTEKNLSRQTFKLRDGSINTIDIKKGIYHLHGANGSGKSTLLNNILDYERKYLFQKFNSDSFITSITEPSKIRIIDRNPVIFSCIKHFHEQIFGPNYQQNIGWRTTIETNLSLLFSSPLIAQWNEIIKDLENKYSQRDPKNFSSGEKVMLSFIRFIASWDKEVNILVIDECDAFLDKEKKLIFINSLIQLSEQLAIYLTSHEFIHKKFNNTKLIQETKDLVAY